MPETSDGPTPMSLNGSNQLKESLVFKTMASVPFLALWRMVAAVLQTHAQSPVDDLGDRRRASTRGALRQSKRDLVMA